MEFEKRADMPGKQSNNLQSPQTSLKNKKTIRMLWIHLLLTIKVTF